MTEQLALFEVDDLRPKRFLTHVTPDPRPRTEDRRIIRARRCSCCGARTLGGADRCRFCRVEECAGQCGPLYPPPRGYR